VSYGAKVLELAKGKVTVEVGTEKDLLPTSCEMGLIGECSQLKKGADRAFFHVNG
jgi:hypothetical protein